MQSWCELILDFARHHKLYCLNIPEAVATSPLFNNNKIQRRLSVDVARIFLDYVVSKNFGEWLDKEKNNILLYWRTPEEWANIIYKRICDLGMTDTVVTFYELTESESAANEGNVACCVISRIRCISKRLTTYISHCRSRLLITFRVLQTGY
jgi:ESCRT-II complex subunit VPS25